MISINKKNEIKNLRTFAKLYGYIRFFHPSDEASKIDWNKFAVYGVEKVKNAKDNEELKEILKTLFIPIAPTVQIYSSNEKPKGISEIFPKDTAGLKIVAWQHYGVGLSEKASYYKSIRVFSNSKVGNLSAILQTKKYFESSPQDVKLFEILPKSYEVFQSEIGSELLCKIPLTIYHDDSLVTIGCNQLYPFQLLKKSFDTFQIIDTTANNVNIRLANIVIAWNVLQHFYPYFKEIKINWDNVLFETLLETLLNKSTDDYYDTLRKMVSKLNDGHGFVYFKNKEWGGVPIRVEWIENQAVISESEDSLFHRGDIIKSIDGKLVKEYLLNVESYISGSPQLKRYRALNQFGIGSIGSILTLELVRNNKMKKMEIIRVKESRSHAINDISPFDFPKIKRIEEGIYYVNLAEFTEKEFYKNLIELSKAKGIIFDWRWDGKSKIEFDSDNIRLIIKHLIKVPIQSAKFNIPNVIYPDRNNMTFTENQWSIFPLKPHFISKNVFITESFIGSSLETDMSIIDYYNLGEIVGQCTGGFNGSANFIPLMGGFEIRWTGMKVLKHDGSQHHLIGIQPTYPVKRTIQAVKEGRDEYLEKAIEIIKTNINK